MAKRSNKWSNERLCAAMEAVKSKQISTRAAAKTFVLPPSTLSDHLRGKSTKRYGGQSTVLTHGEEQEIVVACQSLQKFGFPMTMQIVGKIVHDYISSTKQPHRFRDCTPGPDWWRGFFKRWPSLSQRKPEHMPRNRAQGSRPDVG